MGRLALAWTVLLALAACDGSGREEASPNPEPTRLFLAGDGELTVVDVDAARAKVHRVPELAPGDPRYRIVRRGDQLVLFGFDTYVVDVDLRSQPRKLGDSWFFIPGAEPDRVWLTELDPSSPETERALAGVREVSADGRVTVSGVRPPGGRWPHAAVGSLLVLEDGKGGLELWNPSTREFERRLPSAELGPGQGDLLAWCERDGLVLHVLDVRTGDDRAIEPPEGFGGFQCWSGAFSPDGATLAVGIVLEARVPDAEGVLALVDVEDGVATPVESSSVHPHYGFVAWSAAGDRVFMSGGGALERRLLEYRLGERRATEILVRVPAFYGMAAK
jgi:hypothetical protein